MAMLWVRVGSSHTSAQTISPATCSSSSTIPAPNQAYLLPHLSKQYSITAKDKHPAKELSLSASSVKYMRQPIEAPLRTGTRYTPIHFDRVVCL